ncbi:MAG TPA: STAS domain-containing protein [Nitrospirota bacterium]|nr:STAS domain-containing protein [Nitrospirota bacterium]
MGGDINFIDVAGCEMLTNEAHHLHLSRRELYLCSLKGEVMDVVRRGGYLDRIGHKNVFRTKSEALRKIVFIRFDP